MDRNCTMPVIDVYFLFARGSFVCRHRVGWSLAKSWCVFLTIYALLLTDFWLECIRKELRYMFNGRYLARTNDIWALDVVLVTVVNRHTVLTTVIPSSQKDASQNEPSIGA